MPMYCFACDCGHEFETFRPISDYDQPMPCPKCGDVAHRDVLAEQGGYKHGAGAYPHNSDFFGCPPAQRAEMSTFLRSKGATTEITADGNYVVTSRAHKLRILKALKQEEGN